MLIWWYILNIICLIWMIVSLLNKAYWYLWINYSYKFKRGDPIACPHYKKNTYYLYCHLIADYDYYPYFEMMEKNMKEDPTIEYYKWIYYYDEKTGFIEKVEFWCIYTTDERDCIFRFNIYDVMFKDKKGILHTCNDLIRVRMYENHMMAEYYTITRAGNNNELAKIKKIYNKHDVLIGYTINTGNIRYEIRRKNI